MHKSFYFEGGIRMKKKFLGVLLSVAMVSALFAGCGNKDKETAADPTKAPEATEAPAADDSAADPTAAPAAAGLAYTGEINLMHYSTEEEAKGNGGADGFRTMLAEWKEANPGVTVSENVLANTDYKNQIATLAAAGNLPDVFLLQGMNAVQWAKEGLILDLTDSVNNSPDKANYVMDYFAPYTVDGKIYGIPVLTGGTCTAVIYNSELWKEAGFDSFPKTWDEVLKAKDFFDKKGIATVGFGNKDGWQANSTFLTVMGNRFTGQDWTESIITRSGAKFTDPEFVEALKFTQDIFASGLFNQDFNAIDHYTARELYVNGQCAAYIGGNWDVSDVGVALKENDPDLYAKTKIAVIPQPANAKGAENTQAFTVGYALAINSKVAEDPDKLAAALDLCYKLTGQDFADFVSNKWALSGLTKPAKVDLSKFDQYTQDFYNYSYVDTTPCYVYDSYLSGDIWGQLNPDLQAMMNGDMTPEQVAQNVQKVYEASK